MWDLPLDLGGDLAVESGEPILRDGGESIGRAGQHSSQCAGCVRIAALVHGLDETISEGLGREIEMHRRLHRLDDIGGGFPRIGLEAQLPMSFGQSVGLRARGRLAAADEESLRHVDKRKRCGVRQRVMMGDVALREGPGFGLGGTAEGGERDRQDAHGGAVSGVRIAHGPGERPLRDITANAPTACVADVDRPGLQPCGEFLANIAAVEAAAPRQRAGEGEGHFRIVGDLPRRETKPAAADDLSVPAMPRDDLLLGEKLDRRAKRVADREAEESRERPILQAESAHGAARLEHVPIKLNDFFDENMLQLFDSE